MLTATLILAAVVVVSAVTGGLIGYGLGTLAIALFPRTSERVGEWLVDRIDG